MQNVQCVSATPRVSVGEDLQAVLLGLLLEKLLIHPSVLVHEEHIPAVIPARRDMMGTPHGNRSGYSMLGK
jgi:hypothetical protein